MKIRQKLFLSFFAFWFLTAQACSFPETKTQKRKPVINDITSRKSEKEDAFKRVEEFSKYVLKENLRIHEFDFSNKDSLYHFKLFKIDGLTYISAYSDKRYPKKIEPSHYEHYAIFIFKYSTEAKAKNAIKKLVMASQTLLKTRTESLWDSLDTFTKNLHFSSKSGGFICQKDNYIFSLVETCRDTPLGGTWPEYEDTFMSFLLSENESIVILNADCGQMKYRLEKKTKSTDGSVKTAVLR